LNEVKRGGARRGGRVNKTSQCDKGKKPSSQKKKTPLHLGRAIVKDGAFFQRPGTTRLGEAKGKTEKKPNGMSEVDCERQGNVGGGGERLGEKAPSEIFTQKKRYRKGKRINTEGQVKIKK